MLIIYKYCLGLYKYLLSFKISVCDSQIKNIKNFKLIIHVN